jgi:hypothetical protein
VSTWFPQGLWTNFISGDTVRGPVVKTVTADYTTMPVYAKQGAIIPMQAYMDYVGQKKLDSLAVMAYPGADGAFTLYEDEGENLNFKSGNFTLTPLTYRENGKSLTIGAATGAYTGAPTQRSYMVTFVNRGTPSIVTINGTAVNQETAGSGEGWWMSGSSVVIHVNARPVTSNVVIATAVATGVAGQKQTGSRALPMFRILQNAGKLTISFLNNQPGEPFSVMIRDLSGRVLFDKKSNDASTVTLASKAVIAKGIILVTLKKQDAQITKKILVP